ncbi:MAG: hypothetical protein ACOYZ7_14990 [Chloroflexota bacterium]
MNRCLLFRILVPLSLAMLFLPAFPIPPAQAVGETSTRFGVFVPPNGSYTSRDPVLIVTAVQDGTAVDIVDDASDGDSDDTVTGLTLNTGQSYILYIQEGAVDDDGPAGGSRKADGNVILASTPAVGDLDADGDIEVAIGSFDGRVYVWDESGGWRADAAPWPAFHGGAAHTGVVDTGSFQPLPEVYGLHLPLASKGQ